MSFAEHLAGLDTAQLTHLLEHRPDVLVEPAPRSLHELALRLDSVDSVHAALARVDADEALVIQAIALAPQPSLTLRLAWAAPRSRSARSPTGCARGGWLGSPVTGPSCPGAWPSGSTRGCHASGRWTTSAGRREWTSCGWRSPGSAVIRQG